MLELVSKAKAAVTFPEIPLIDESQDFTEVVGDIVAWLLIFAGVVAVIYLIYGGLLYITAGGDAEKSKSGRTALINAIIGIVIIALAFLIVQWVGRIVESGTAG